MLCVQTAQKLLTTVFIDQLKDMLQVHRSSEVRTASETVPDTLRRRDCCCRVLSRVDAAQEENLASPQNGGLQAIAENVDLQSSLLICAAQIVAFTFHGPTDFFAHLIKAGHQVKELRLWLAVGIFWLHLEESPDHAAPMSIAELLKMMR